MIKKEDLKPKLKMLGKAMKKDFSLFLDELRKRDRPELIILLDAIDKIVLEEMALYLFCESFKSLDKEKLMKLINEILTPIYCKGFAPLQYYIEKSKEDEEEVYEEHVNIDEFKEIIEKFFNGVYVVMDGTHALGIAGTQQDLMDILGKKVEEAEGIHLKITNKKIEIGVMNQKEWVIYMALNMDYLGPDELDTIENNFYPSECAMMARNFRDAETLAEEDYGRNYQRLTRDMKQEVVEAEIERGSIRKC